jgi:hypothetical protein
MTALKHWSTSALFRSFSDWTAMFILLGVAGSLGIRMRCLRDAFFTHAQARGRKMLATSLDNRSLVPLGANLRAAVTRPPES